LHNQYRPKKQTKQQSTAAKIQAAVTDVLSEGKIRPPDLGGTATTTDMSNALIQKICQL
jgi:isocitrate/isopropylmalate dehydrogenase